MKHQLHSVMQTVQANPADTSAAAQLKQLTEAMEQYQKGLSLLTGGTPTTITEGKIPDAHIVFLDEIFKAGDGILNSLLTVLHEKRYTNEGVTMQIPVISFFSASNEIPNFRNKEEQILAPLYDRFQLKVVTHNVQKRKARLKILHEKQNTQFGAVTATVTLDELYAMQSEVKAVVIPPSINELMDDVLCELRRQSITVSDRKFFGFGRIAQAAAWLNGHAEVQPNDLLSLKNYLWNEPKEIETVSAVLEKLCDNPLRTRLEELLHKGRDAFEAFNAAPSVKALVPLRSAFAALYQEWRGQNSEKPVAVIRLAVDRDFKRDGDPDADFFNCSVFGNQAKFVLEYGKKGRLVSLVGRMQQREWTDQQTGEKHTAYEVAGSDIKFLDKKPENVGTPAAQNHAAPNMAPPAPVQPPMNDYPQPIPGAAAQYPTPDFSGVPDSYAWGPGGTPMDNPPF